MERDGYMDDLIILGTIRDPQPPKVFIVSWLDYCAKYGMGWALCDGTMGVHFNDTSTIALCPANT